LDTIESFGYWVRRRRKALDLTQGELAQCVGCAVVSLRKIEADERRPSRQMAERLALCLELPADETSEFLAVAFGKRSSYRVLLPNGESSSLAASNLPVMVNPLIGRTTELAAIVSCLRRKDVRLHTLTGPVGVGKTRLAIEAGLRLRQEFKYGVHLIALAPVQDPALVPAITASVLGVREARGHSLVKSIADHLAQKDILLIFDNFEHLQPAAAFLLELLHCAPGLRLLVTSRAVLHLYGEHEYVVSPMAVPNANNLEEAARAASVQLFYERAQAVQADFCLTPDLIPVVAAICRRLDGLPLAIELAAVRIKLFSAQELLQRLERRLPLLTQGPADLPLHDQVLENAIAWSYGLLSPSDRALLNRLAVFQGGFTLAAAETVTAFPFTLLALSTGLETTLEVPDIMNSLSTLLDQSLLMRQKIGAAPAESRFVMLDTIREFAQEQLQARDEHQLMQKRHAEYFATWAADAEAHLYGPEQADWLICMELEADNLRTALSWSIGAGQRELAARIACALAVFWRRRGHYIEGRSWLEKVLPLIQPDCLPDTLRARTLQAAGSLAYRQGDWPAAQQWLDESLRLFQTCGDQTGSARVLFDLGWIAIDQGDWIEAARLNQESLTLAREAADCLGIYRALTNLGWTNLCTGEQNVAAELFAEAYDLARHAGHIKGVAVSLVNLGWIALERGDLTSAMAQTSESLRLCHLLGEREVMAECLEVLIVVALKRGEYERATKLSGAAHALWAALHVTRSPTQYSTAAHAEAAATLHRNLSDGIFSSNWQEGGAMSLDVLVAFTLDGGTD
jgi:predicted ATPase/transcriptional regulator with XRE-family HTH domain